MKNNILVIWEFLKSKKLLLICVISLIALCAITTIFTQNNDIPAKDLMAVVFDDYYVNPIEFDDTHQVWMQTYDLYQKLLLDTAKSNDVHNTINPPTIQYKSVTYDKNIYDRFYTSLFRQQAYMDQIEDIISAAHDNISANLQHSYQRKYNEKLISIYSYAQQNTYIGFEDARGWNSHLENPYPGFFTFIIMTFISASLFSIEYNSGMHQIIFTSKIGRRKTYVSKLICLFLYSFLFLLIAETTSLFIIHKMIGLSNPYNGIQIFEQYTFCPYPISILEYCLLSFISKLIIIFLGCIVTALITHLLKRSIYSLICSLFSLSIAYVLMLLTPNEASLPFLLNPLTNLLSSKAFQRYSASYLFIPIDNKVLCLTIFALIFSISLILLLTLKPYHIAKTSLHKKIVLSSHSKKIKCYPLSLIFFETQKQMTLKKILICVSLILIQSLFLSYVYGGEHSEEDKIYLEYMEYLSGEISDEKSQYIKNERQRLDDILSCKTQMDDLYGSQEISLQEYSNYLFEYEYALSHTSVLDRVQRYDKYLHEKSAQKSAPAHFIYSSGYENLFASGNDVLLLLAVFFISSEIYTCEYTKETSLGESIKLIRTTKYGRKKTVIAKYVSFCLIAASLYIISTVFRLVIIKSHWLITSFFAPTYSLEVLENFEGNIFNFITFYFIIRWLILIILSSFLLLLSYKRKSGNSIFIVMVTLICIPYVFEFIGLPFPKILNIIKLYNLFL